LPIAQQPSAEATAAKGQFQRLGVRSSMRMRGGFTDARIRGESLIVGEIGI
jgi:hypothetical protein